MIQEPLKSILMFGITSKREPVKGDFAKKVKAAIAQSKSQSGQKNYGCESATDKKYVVTIRK